MNGASTAQRMGRNDQGNEAALPGRIARDFKKRPPKSTSSSHSGVSSWRPEFQKSQLKDGCTGRGPVPCAHCGKPGHKDRIPRAMMAWLCDHKVPVQTAHCYCSFACESRPCAGQYLRFSEQQSEVAPRGLVLSLKTQGIALPGPAIAGEEQSQGPFNDYDQSPPPYGSRYTNPWSRFCRKLRVEPGLYRCHPVL